MHALLTSVIAYNKIAIIAIFVKPNLTYKQ